MAPLLTWRQRKICATLLVLGELEEREKRKRRWWTKELYLNREQYGLKLLFKDIKQDPCGLMNFLRVQPPQFEELLNLIGPMVQKRDTKMRKAVSIQDRLGITLRFLATGETFSSLRYVSRISKQSLSAIIPEVAAALYESLKDYVKVPQTEEQWRTVAQGYKARWNFPHCLGALDGKHIRVKAPMKSGSKFMNYKDFFSVVLLALVDSDYNFIYFNVGCQGRISDGGVFMNSSLFCSLQENKLKVPAPEALPGRTALVPYVIVGDDAFAQSSYLIKPYPGTHPHLTPERIFNYRLCRARRVVENVFGILSARFRVFRTTMELEPEKVMSVTKACVVLHNFLRTHSPSRAKYSPPGTFDIENVATGVIRPGNWRRLRGTHLEPFHAAQGRPCTDGVQIRQEFTEYFSNEGAVSWQENLLLRF